MLTVFFYFNRFVLQASVDAPTDAATANGQGGGLCPFRHNVLSHSTDYHQQTGASYLTKVQYTHNYYIYKGFMVF